MTGRQAEEMQRRARKTTRAGASWRRLSMASPKTAHQERRAKLVHAEAVARMCLLTRWKPGHGQELEEWCAAAWPVSARREMVARQWLLEPGPAHQCRLLGAEASARMRLLTCWKPGQGQGLEEWRAAARPVQVSREMVARQWQWLRG
jgi:hypothetical protein